jgi:hypothetical protein
MFVPQRWAQGFVNAAGDTGTAALALEYARVMGAPVLAAKGRTAGTVAARRLGQLFRRAFAAVPAATAAVPGAAAPDRVAEDEARSLALGLILLLVKKNLLRYTGRVIEAVERELDGRRGILRARLDYARDPGAEFTEQLKNSLMLKTGAAGIRLSTNAVPELLAGCRLRIGGGIIDASLQTRLKGLEAELARAEFPVSGPPTEVVDGRL